MDAASTQNDSYNVFSEIHGHTSSLTTADRFITYNILADLYAFRDIEDYSPYCSPEHLDCDYRQKLLVREVKGYNGDIICLQEVDVKVFRGNLTGELQSNGLDGIYFNKRGKRRELTEGSAMYYRKSKFKLVEQKTESIVHLLEHEPVCEDIKEWAYSRPSWKASVEVQPHTVQIVVLEWTEQPGNLLIVCNTHLLWDEVSPHVRYIQILVAIRVLEQFMKKYKSQDPGVIYCGDFNARPDEYMIQFVLQNDPNLINAPTKQNPDSPNNHVSHQSPPTTGQFSHNFRFGNACGVRPYTCLTKIFRGHLDYMFYDLDRLKVTKVIPQLDDAIVTRHTALPNVDVPSDHLAQICEFTFKK